jgi:F-type H+-transporting ATPase subunit a
MVSRQPHGPFGGVLIKVNCVGRRWIYLSVMRLVRIILAFVLVLATGAVLQAATHETIQAEPAMTGTTEAAAAEAASHPAAAEAHAEHHGLPSAALPVFAILGLPVTNSMLVTWIVALGLIVFAQVAMRNVQLVPRGAQNFWEFLVESLLGFLEGILGRGLARRTFWFFTTIFLFILCTNWFGLLPGIGTIGWGEHPTGSFLGLSTFSGIARPLFRGGNADLNMTAAMAMIFMVLWFVWSLQEVGAKGFVLHIFGPKGDSTGFIKYMMIVIFFLVGFLELISIAFRPVSLSFRLYGNIFAGENLLEAMSNVVQNPPWAKAVFSALLPVPFYFLELLVGLVQAFVFMLLTTVFTALMCAHEEDHAKEHH